jgi:hypothetical protein
MPPSRAQERQHEAPERRAAQPGMSRWLYRAITALAHVFPSGGRTLPEQTSTTRISPTAETPTKAAAFAGPRVANPQARSRCKSPRFQAWGWATVILAIAPASTIADGIDDFRALVDVLRRLELMVPW